MIRGASHASPLVQGKGVPSLRRDQLVFMDQDDQNYVIQNAQAAAAAAAAYANKKARDESRKALLIALSQNMSSLDPKGQEQLRRLLEAETRRVQQENFEWRAGLIIGLVILGGILLFFLAVFSHAR